MKKKKKKCIFHIFSRIGHRGGRETANGFSIVPNRHNIEPCVQRDECKCCAVSVINNEVKKKKNIYSLDLP